MRGALLLAAALVALAGIQAEWKEARTRRFFMLKPFATLLVLLGAAQGSPSPYRTGILWALGLGLLGDVCLLAEGDAAFLAGLGSFLWAHVAYAYAFWKAGAGRPPLWSLAFGAYALGFFAWLLPRTGRLKGPVLVYGAVLLTMALVGVGVFASGQPRGPMVLVGVLAFVASDSALAARRFGGPYPLAQPLILATYYGAILCFAASV